MDEGFRPVRRNRWLLLLFLGLTGCLPSSCHRQDSRALFASDSLSRQVAASVPVDTLILRWESNGSEEHPLEFPRTVLLGSGSASHVYVSDVERSSVFVFDSAGSLIREVRAGFDLPYLAGLRGDTLLVFNPTMRRIDFISGTERVDSLHVQVEVKPDALLYAGADASDVYFKAASRSAGVYVARLDEGGYVAEKRELPGPDWRHAGFLRIWGDTLLSLSGYRPLVDILPRDLSAPADTMALVGFDSPMLARSRSFARGEAKDPPLLTSSAAPAGEYLFVLNMRMGWLQIDVFDRSGRLRSRLSEADSTYHQQYFPQDLAVRQHDHDRFDIVVVFNRPLPRVALYRARVPLPKGEVSHFLPPRMPPR